MKRKRPSSSSQPKDSPQLHSNRGRGGGEGNKETTSQRPSRPQPQPGDPNYKTPTQLRNARKRRRRRCEKEDHHHHHHQRHRHHRHQHQQQEQDEQEECNSVIRPPRNSNGAAATPTTTTIATNATKKQKIRSIISNVNSNVNVDVDADGSSSSSSIKAIKNTLDPSLKYISNPVHAPTVQAAIQFFRQELQEQNDDQLTTTTTTTKRSFQVYVGPYLGWRTVARLAVRSSSSSSSSSSSPFSNGLGDNNNNNKLLRIGLFAPKSHTIVEQHFQHYHRHQQQGGASSSSSSPQTLSPFISVHHRRIDTLVSVVQKKCRQYQIQAYDERSGRGNLRHVAVSIQRSTGKQQLVLVWNDDDDDDDDDDNSAALKNKTNDLGNNNKNNNTMDNYSPRNLLIQSLIEMSRKEENKYNRFVQEQLKKREKQQKKKKYTKQQQKQQQRSKNENKKQKNQKQQDSPPPSSLDTYALSTHLAEMYSNHNQGPVHLHSLWVHTNNCWKHGNNIIDRNGTWDLQYCWNDFDDDNTNNNNSSSSSSNSSSGSNINDAADADSDDLTDNSGTSFLLEEHLVRYISNIHPDLNIPLYFPPQVFRQANLDGFAKIISSIRRWLISSFGGAGDIGSSSTGAGISNSNSNSNRQNNYGDKSYNDRHQPRTAPIIGHCLELYGGVGTIGLHLIDLISSLESSDENPYNKKCFELSVKRLGSIQSTTSTDDDDPDASSLTSIADNGTKSYLCPKSKIVYKSKSATQMVDSGSLRNAKIVIVDPPRKGLDDEVVSALCLHPRGHQRKFQTKKSTSNNDDDHHHHHHPNGQQRRHHNEQWNYGEHQQQQQHNIQALIYVSCGFDAFQRDYHRLVGSGIWELDHAEGHVLFPGSDAIETLACFHRRRRH